MDGVLVGMEGDDVVLDVDGERVTIPYETIQKARLKGVVDFGKGRGAVCMSSELMDALKALAREKNIDEYQMLDKLEQSLAGTYQRILDLENHVRVTIDRETGRIYVYELIPVGEMRRGDRRGRVLRGARRHARRRLAASPPRTPRT